MIRLSAGEAAALIDPDDGGRLISLAASGNEYLLEPRYDDGTVPMSGSFVMAPWVGEITRGEVEFRGESYRLPVNEAGHAVHGLVMRGPWDVLESSERSAVLSRPLVDPWPFGGVVRQEFELDPAGLRQAVTIHAGSVAMPASVGWHPWFRRADNGPTRVRVDADVHLELDDDRLPTGRTRAVEGDTDLREQPVLGARRIDEAFVDVTGPAEIVAGADRLVVEFDVSIRTVVVYTPPEAVCLEPWSAWPDAIRLQALGYDSGAVVLEPGESLRRSTYWAWSPAGDVGPDSQR
jgi:aldose 1-epimerase